MSETLHRPGSNDSLAVPFAAGLIVMTVIAAIAAVVRFVFADAAIAGVIGYGALFVVAMATKLFPRR